MKTAARRREMRLSDSVKPISHFKSHASEIIREVVESHNPVVITLNGEAKAIIQDLREYEQDRESLALLKMLSLSRKSVDAGNYLPADDAFSAVRQLVAENDGQ
jgi:prevent-host-death family protein